MRNFRDFVTVELVIEDDSEMITDVLFVHLASTKEKAIEWIRNNGKDWASEEYYFLLFKVELDDPGCSEEKEFLGKVSKDGEIIPDALDNEDEMLVGSFYDDYYQDYEHTWSWDDE